MTTITPPATGPFKNDWRLACPACGDTGRLQVVVTTWANLSPEGTEVEGDHEWDASSPARCACGCTGTVDEFTIQPTNETHQS